MKEIDFGISPRLKVLQLKKLPKLSNVICNEDENANKRCLLSPSTFKNFQNLQDIGVIDCGKEDRREVSFSAFILLFSNIKGKSKQKEIFFFFFCIWFYCENREEIKYNQSYLKYLHIFKFLISYIMKRKQKIKSLDKYIKSIYFLLFYFFSLYSLIYSWFQMEP